MKALLICCLLCLMGCGNSDHDEPAASSQANHDHLLSTQTEALDKARAVEDELLEQAQHQREQIDDDSN